MCNLHFETIHAQPFTIRLHALAVQHTNTRTRSPFCGEGKNTSCFQLLCSFSKNMFRVRQNQQIGDVHILFNSFATPFCPPQRTWKMNQHLLFNSSATPLQLLMSAPKDPPEVGRNSFSTPLQLLCNSFEWESNPAATPFQLLGSSFAAPFQLPLRPTKTRRNSSATPLQLLFDSFATL